MAAMFSENAQAILKFLQANKGSDLTAPAIAEATGLTTQSVNGVVTGLQRKGLTIREEVEGFEKKVIRLTAAGEQVDPAAEKPEADAE